eukprot:365567_1
MSSACDRKLRLLIYGYIQRENISTFIPNDIVKSLILWSQPNLTTEVNLISDCYSIQLEIYLTGFISNLLNNESIKRYKMNYIENVDYENEVQVTGIETFVTEHKASVKYAFTKCIYETNCISFIDLNVHFLRHEKMHILFQIIAMDNDSNIIAESQWKSFERNFHLMIYCEYEQKPVDDFFETEIDVHKKGNINAQDWVLAISNMEIFKEIFDVFDCKKVFHFIQHLSQLMNERLYV